MTSPNDPRALVARLAGLVAMEAKSPEVIEMAAAIAAAAREAETGQGIGTDASTLGAPVDARMSRLDAATPAPSPADDVETVQTYIGQTVWQGTSQAVTFDDANAAIHRLAARLARFEALAERAHRVCHVDTLDTDGDNASRITTDLAALRREGR